MINLACTLDRNDNDSHTFCQIHFQICGHIIGDIEAWSVASLMVGSISDMLSILKKQSVPVDIQEFLRQLDKNQLFDLLQTGKLQNCHVAKKTLLNEIIDFSAFNCLPQATEIFDGERAYLIRISDNSCRLIWRDFISKEVMEEAVGFGEYLGKWELIKAELNGKTVV